MLDCEKAPTEPQTSQSTKHRLSLKDFQYTSSTAFLSLIGGIDEEPEVKDSLEVVKDIT
jgi:hypothetical protein